MRSAVVTSFDLAIVFRISYLLPRGVSLRSFGRALTQSLISDKRGDLRIINLSPGSNIFTQHFNRRAIFQHRGQHRNLYLLRERQHHEFLGIPNQENGGPGHIERRFRNTRRTCRSQHLGKMDFPSPSKALTRPVSNLGPNSPGLEPEP